jgi:hypothetical protein
VVEVDEDIGGPEPLTKLFAGDDLAGGFDQDRQKLKRLLRQSDSGSVPGQLSGLEIELEEAEANRLLDWQNRHSAPPESARTEFSTPREANPLTLSTLTGGDKIA